MVAFPGFLVLMVTWNLKNVFKKFEETSPRPGRVVQKKVKVGVEDGKETDS